MTSGDRVDDYRAIAIDAEDDAPAKDIFAVANRIVSARERRRSAAAPPPPPPESSEPGVDELAIDKRRQHARALFGQKKFAAAASIQSVVVRGVLAHVGGPTGAVAIEMGTLAVMQAAANDEAADETFARALAAFACADVVRDALEPTDAVLAALVPRR
jgi:hypothetical protein